MMKKLTVFVLILSMLVGFTACNPKENSSEGEEAQSEISGSEVVSKESSEEESETPPQFDIDMASSYICDGNKREAVQIVYNSPAEEPEGDGAIFCNTSTGRSEKLPDAWYCIHIERKISSYTVAEVSVNSTSTEYFTIAFRNQKDIEKAKAYFKKGASVMLVNMSETHRYGNKPTLVIGNSHYTIDNYNTTEKNESDVFLFDSEWDSNTVPHIADGQKVALIVKDTVIYVSKKDEEVVFPVKNGIAAVFTGKSADVLDIAFGEEAEFLKLYPKTSPSNYVECNGVKQEVNYFNTSRTAYSTAVYYDDGFYSSVTNTNEWGLEIAVDKEGYVVEVKQDGTKGVSGNSFIPEGGFVLSVGSGSPLRRTLSKTLINEKVAVSFDKTPYFVYQMTIDGKNKAREGETAVLYDASYGKQTPAVANGQLELICDGDGYVISYGNPNGKTAIPEKGFVIAFYGAKYDEAISFVSLGSRLAVNQYCTRLTIVNYPQVVYGDGKTLYEAYKKQYGKCVEELYNIDYSSVDSNMSELKRLIEDAENSASVSQRLTSLAKAYDLAISMQYTLSPKIAVQDRAAWIVTPPFDENEVRKMCQSTVKYGLNTIIVSVWDGVYAMYKSKIDGVMTGDKYKNFDALEAFCRIGHEMGLEVIAMPCCFAAGTTLDLPSEHYVAKFYSQKKLLLSRSGTYENRYYDNITYTLDLYDKDVRDFMLSVYREILENYDFDGLQLDYIRFPLPNSFGNSPDDFGYNPATVRAFQAWADTNVDPHSITMSHGLWTEWCAFRREIVTSFAKEVRQLVDSVKPQISFTCTCFSDYTDRQNYVLQDTEKLLDDGIVDSVFTMIYADNYDGEKKYGVDLAKRTAHGFDVVLGIGTYVRAGKYDIVRQMYLPFEIGSRGFGVFGLAYIQTCGYGSVFESSVTREQSVRTDKYDKTVCAGIAELISCIDGVYKRFCPDEDFSSLKAEAQKLLDLSEKANCVTESEKEAYALTALNLLSKLKKTYSFGNKKLLERVNGQIDYLINCLN